jgi:hypothetical protein
MPRVTPTNAQYAFGGPVNRAVLLHRADKIIAARRSKPALPPHKRTERPLINPNEQDQRPRRQMNEGLPKKTHSAACELNNL